MVATEQFAVQPAFTCSGFPVDMLQGVAIAIISMANKIICASPEIPGFSSAVFGAGQFRGLLRWRGKYDTFLLCLQIAPGVKQPERIIGKELELAGFQDSALSCLQRDGEDCIGAGIDIDKRLRGLILCAGCDEPWTWLLPFVVNS